MEPKGIPVRPSVVRIIGLGVSALALAGGVVVGLAGSASACSCATAGTRQHVDQADVVVTGTLVGTRDHTRGPVVSSADPITYTIEVDQAFKGSRPGKIQFISARFGASCGLEGMKVDRRYTLFLQRGDDGLSANLCGGSRTTDDVLEQQITRWTGPPATVDTATQPAPDSVETGIRMEPPRGSDAEVWLVLAGCGLTVLGGASAWIWRRRAVA